MRTNKSLVLGTVVSFALLSPVFADAPAKPDAQMQVVLDAQTKLGAKPIYTLSVSEARKGPTVGDGANEVLKEQHKSTKPEAVGSIDNVDYPTFDKKTGKARVYTPADASSEGPLPIIVYWHGGGWVIGSLDAYDVTPRILANGAHAIVVSCDYRESPENKFPTAHDDALACYQWVLANTAKLKGDGKRIAIAGESAGGNMAAGVAIEARDQKLQAPVYQLLIYPVAGGGFDQPSYQTYMKQQPLDTPTVKWMLNNYIRTPADANNPRLAIVNQANLASLPPATVITAEIDPLNSEGRAYAKKLIAAGVPVDFHNYEGVTHEFFPLGTTVDKAKEAEAAAIVDLTSAFAGDKVEAGSETP